MSKIMYIILLLYMNIWIYIYLFSYIIARSEVNVMTGRKGWHRRINKTSTQVKRSAEFSDGVAIDDGAGMDKLEQAIKKATLKSTKIAKVATFHHTGSAGSTSDCRVFWSFINAILFVIVYLYNL